MSAAFNELDKIDIVDKLNLIGNNFAISTDGLATALQNSASALKTAGNDIDESIALATAANAVVQDPDKVGAGLRTIALRITGTEAAKEELAELGEDVDDFVVTTSSKLNEQVKNLTKTVGKDGISLLDDNGNYRSTYEILQDIADVWEEIAAEDLITGQNRQNALLEMLAGKNRSNILASILQSPETLRDAYNASLNDSEGSAQEELEKYLDSIEGRIQLFQNRLQEFWYNLIDSDIVKDFVDAGTKLIDILDNILSGLTKSGAIDLISGFLTSTIDAIAKITDGLGSLSTIIAGVLGVSIFKKINRISGGILKNLLGFETKKDIAREIRDLLKGVDVEDEDISLFKGFGSQFDNVKNKFDDFIGYIKASVEIDNILPSFIGDELKSDSLEKYVQAIRELDIEQAKAALSSTMLSSSQQAQVLTAAGLLTTTNAITAEQQEQLITSGLLTSEQIAQIASTLGLTAAESGALVATEALSAADVKLKLEQMGIVGTTQAQILSILGLTAAEGSATVATGLLSKAVLALHAAWMASPTGVIVAGIAAILGVVLAATKIYDKFQYTVKKSTERLDEFNSKFEEQRNSYKSHAELVGKVAESYDELAKKVNTDTNYNLGLSEDEYKEFIGMNNELAESFPTLVKGYDESGNAIIDFGNNCSSAADKLNELLEAEKNSANMEIAKNLPEYFKNTKVLIEDYDEQIADYEQKINSLKKTQALLNNTVTGNFDLFSQESISAEDLGIDTFNELYNVLAKSSNEFFETLSDEEISELQGLHIDMSNLITNDGDNMWINAVGMSSELKSRLQDIININASTLAGSVNDALSDAQNALKDAKAGKDESWSAFTDNLIAGMSSKATYQGLTAAGQELANTIVKSMDSSVASAMGDDPYGYVRDNILSTFSDLTNGQLASLNSAIKDFGNIDMSDLTITGQEEARQKLIDTIKSIVPGKEGNDLVIALGLEIQTDTQKAYDSLMSDIDAKLGEGYSEKWNSSIQFYLDKYNINSEEELMALRKFFNETGNLADAFNLYAASIEKAANATDNLNKSSEKFSKSQMIDTINDMSDGFDILDNIYADIYDKGKFDFTNLDSSKFEEAFKGLGTEYTEFIETVSESPNDISACQEAFDKLATAFIESKGILENLTEENANVAAAMLKNMGIANAEEIVMAQLEYQLEMTAIKKQFLLAYTKDLSEATYEEVIQFIQESEYSAIAEQALAQLALSKISVNEETIDTSEDINNIINLANAAGASTIAIAKLKEAKEILSSESDGSIGWLRRYEAAERLIEDIESGNFDWGFKVLDPSDFKVTDYDLYKPVYEGAEKTASAVAESAKDAYGDMFDFFERRVKVLEDAFGNLEAGIENVLGADAKNTLLSAQLGILDEEVNNYTDALAMYKEQANNVLSTISDPALREKIVNGSVSLVDLQGENNEQVKAALEAYQGWADKIAECTQKLEQLKTQIRQLELQKFNNIIEDFTDQFDIRGTAIDNIDKQIGLLEESGELVGKGYYEQQIIQAKGQLNILERQKSEMVKSLADAINSGRIQKGTEEWQEMVTAIQQIDGQIIECKTDVEKFSNSIQEIDWNNFNRLQDIFSGIHDELGNLAGLFDDTNDIAVSDGKGNWTNEALTTMGLYAQQYESAKYQVEQYADEIAELEADYAAGNISATEYIDKLSELKQGQWSAVESMEAAEDALISLNEKRIQESIEAINKEIEAYNDLINAKLEALDAEKDLHDYRQSIAEKSKSITDIEKQLAAMANDDSLAARAKKAQLQEQLSEAQKDLEETEYNHSIEAQRDALSKQAEDYEKARQRDIEKLEESLKNRELLLIQSFNTVKDNATIIGQQILAIAQQHGINVDSVITTAWANGSNAIAGYGQALTTQSSAFISNLEGVELKVLDLQTQADTTSYSIANMFGQQANTLINQLASSWTSENNLNTMTGILQNSLINTLESGYNISSITSALDTIESGLGNVESAARRAKQAILEALGAQEQSKKYYHMGHNGDKWYVKDLYGNYVKYYDSFEEASNALDKMKKYNYNYKAYAKGSKRIQEDQMAWTDEHGDSEMIIRRSDGAILTRLERGDAIANANLAENLFKWGEIAPSSFMQKLLGANSYNVNVPVKSSQPSIVLDYDLNIGNFTDGEHLLNTIQKVSKESATKLLNDINRDFRIRGR